MAAISSSRMRSAVSGVRSWWEASAAKSRSEASDLVSRWALRDSTSETWSSSAMPECSGWIRDSPAPSRSARSASSVIGQRHPPGLLRRHDDPDRERQDRQPDHDEEQP